MDWKTNVLKSIRICIFNAVPNKTSAPVLAIDNDHKTYMEMQKAKDSKAKLKMS